MDDSNQNLTKKERRELRRQERELVATRYNQRCATRRVVFWLGICVVIGGAIFGVIKLAGRAPAGQAALLAEAVSASDWTQGDKNSKVVLVEYSDFECPACRVFYLLLKDIEAKYGTKMELVYRYFPLSYHANSLLAAQAAQAAGKQGKFWEMHDLLFEGQDSWANQNGTDAEETFVSYARSLGLNTSQFKNDLNSPETKAKIEGDYQGGVKSGVDATPTFFLNGKKLPPPASYADFENNIAKAVNANQ